MNWGSPSEFFAMGGYALYVWGSFGAAALCLVIEPLLARKRHVDAVSSLRREVAANKESQ
jgi:heme exporter protein D